MSDHNLLPYGYHTPFFEHVAEPMRQAYRAWKRHKDHDAAYLHASRIFAKDWRHAAYEWIRRREVKARDRACREKTF